MFPILLQEVEVSDDPDELMCSDDWIRLTLSMSCLKPAYTPVLLDTVPWNSSNFSEYRTSYTGQKVKTEEERQAGHQSDHITSNGSSKLQSCWCYWQHTWAFMSFSASLRSFTVSLASAVCFRSYGQQTKNMLHFVVHWTFEFTINHVFLFVLLTCSFSILCLSSASFSIRLAWVSLVSTSFCCRSRCLNTFSKFCAGNMSLADFQRCC